MKKSLTIMAVILLLSTKMSMQAIITKDVKSKVKVLSGSNRDKDNQASKVCTRVCKENGRENDYDNGMPTYGHWGKAWYTAYDGTFACVCVSSADLDKINHEKGKASPGYVYKHPW